MATFTVTTNLDTGDDQSVTGDLAAETADGGGLSLREAILLANAAAGADTIVFAGSTGEAFEAGGTITLSGSELTLSTDITIDGDVSGDGRADVIIDANDASRVFHVSGGSSTLASLDLRNGRSTGDGGAVLINAGATLAIDRTTIRDSDAANGGAIANAGTLDLTTSTISGGSTSGGGGGIHSTGTTNLINATIHGASGFGAGIYVLAGTTTVLNSTLTGNSSDLSFAQGILVESFATLDIANSIVVGNGGSPGSGNGVLGFIDSTITASNTLTTGEAAQIFAQTAVIPGSAVAGGRLADNGGPVETVALRFHGSNPALDAGDDTRAPATDALGNPRIDQPNVGADGANFSDLGAVELQTVLPLPTLTGFGGTVAHTENGPAVVLDTDATIADADADALNGGLGDYAGSSLTVARAGGAEVLDLFGFDAGAASFMAMNGRLYDQNGDAFADVVNSGGRLTVNFTSQDTVATSALVQDVLRSITYATASEAPEDVTVEAAFRGIFGAPVAATVDVDVTGVNSAPTFEVLDPPVVEGTLASGLNVRSGVLGTSVLLQLAVVGDVNGDGIEEVAVSAPRAFLSSAIAGGYALLVDGATGAVLQDHRGTAPFDTLGASIAGVGDVDGDGVVDWAAGLDRSFNPGSVQIYSGASGSVIRTINGGDNFGQAIAGGFDFNGDSVPDIAVVAQRAVSVRSGADGTSLFSVSTPSTFAPAIANAGDVDSDGRNDLIVGDPGFDGAGGRDTGAVSIYSGDGGALLFRIEGSAADESFGLEVGGIGDVDGDG
ncbi:MAG: VCBS repeat-containing protein, partial [Rhodobiaceae bacterium]|nr:VCBS repeat-containing protein [Rhodobiaceae bacterium]